MSDRVLIVGGGVAALESALALRDLAGERVEISMYSPRDEFVYRPFAVADPYGATRQMRYALSGLAERCDVDFRRAAIGAVDGDARRARTHDGEEVAYDYCVVACGSRLLAGVPGAVTFWGVADDGRVRDLIDDLRGKRMRRVAFTMPSGGTWALPLYELALLADDELAKQGVDDFSLVVVTPEDAPLHLFGRVASERVGELLEARGIEVVTGATPVDFEQGRLTVSPRSMIDADAVLSLPRLEGRTIGGVPHDPNGFVPVDDHGRVLGLDRVFAAGDVTSFPVKQGGIAAQQADVVAEAIAAEVGSDVPARPFDPILRGVLWTGADPLYLSGYLTGGHGETSQAGDEPLWDAAEDGKVVSRYLTKFIAESG